MSEKEYSLKIQNVKKKYVIKQFADTGKAVSKLGRFVNRRKIKKEDFWALNGVSFNVEQGEKVGIIGKNGAGKSTLLKIISRITEPTEGRIEITGKVSSMLEVGTGFNQELTGRENVYLNGAILGMTKAEVDEKFDDILEFSEVGKFIDTPVKRYSSGMFVRLAFAVASHLEPDILLVDEVLAVGDTRFQKKCIDKMLSIAASGKTILFVSHQMNTIRQLCDRVVVLKNGEVVFDGDVEEGIRLYSSESFADRKLHYDYDGVARPSGFENNLAQIRSLDILHNGEGIYKAKESIDLRVRVQIKSDEIGDLSCRMHIYKFDGTPVETIFSNAFEYIHEQGEFDINISVLKHNLSPGNYSASIVLTRGNSKFMTGDLDIVENAFSFEVLNPDGTGNSWPRNWANTYNESMEASIIKVEE